MNCELQRIITKDGVALDGVFFDPKKRSKKALLFVHGLTGNFYASREILSALKNKFEKSGFGLASFNNRGNNIVASIHKEDRRKKSGYKSLTIGAAFEKFEDSVFDIETGVLFLKSKGFSKVIVAGISTGANKTAYYFSKSHSKYAKGLILLSPVCDRAAFKKGLGENFERKLKILILKAEKIRKNGKGNELMPKIGNQFPFSAKRFLSLYAEGSSEDTFPYDIPDAKFRALSKIKKPMLVVFGGEDKYLDREPEEIIEIFKEKAGSVEKFDSVIINGGSHGFCDKEKELAEAVAGWIKKN